MITHHRLLAHLFTEKQSLEEEEDHSSVSNVSNPSHIMANPNLSTVKQSRFLCENSEESLIKGERNLCENCACCMLHGNAT